MIKKFNRIDGICVEKIYGQDRFGYSRSDFDDLYDLITVSYTHLDVYKRQE